jgi:hypothetical protein
MPSAQNVADWFYDKWLEPLPYILEVPVSNLGSEAVYPDRIFQSVSKQYAWTAS